MSVLSRAHDSRLRYLRHAASFMATASPAVAAYLSVQSSRLSFDPLDASFNGICSACGAALVEGAKRVVVRSQSQPASSSTKGAPSSATIPRIRETECLRCHRKSTETLPPAGVRPSGQKPQSVQGRIAIPSSKSSAAAATKPTKAGLPSLAKVAKPAPLQTQSASASTSKGKSKSKKMGGLQSMLDKAQTSRDPSKSSFGLSLMDFMSKS